MYKQIYHNLIVCCINDNIVKMFLGMFKYESTPCYLHVNCLMFNAVNRSMIRYVGRLDNYVNCIYKICSGYRLAVYIKDP